MAEMIGLECPNSPFGRSTIKEVSDLCFRYGSRMSSIELLVEGYDRGTRMEAMSMDMQSEIIEIGLAADDGYFPGLFLTAASIAASARGESMLRFNIIDGGIEKNNLEALKDKIREVHPKSIVRVIAFKPLPIKARGPAMAYARLCFPDSIPDVEHLIYCDVDFYWTLDVAEVWARRSSDFAMQAVIDIESSRESEAKWLAERGIRVDVDRYFCSGFSLMNLRLFRTRDIVGKCLRFLERHLDVPLYDQTALNAILLLEDKGVGELPRSWEKYAIEVMDADFAAPMALHFVSICPWKKRYAITDIVDYWHRLYAEYRGLKRPGEIWYSRSRYIVGRLIFIFFSSIWPARKLILLYIDVKYGRKAQQYAAQTIRRIKCPKTACQGC